MMAAVLQRLDHARRDGIAMEVVVEDGRTDKHPENLLPRLSLFPFWLQPVRAAKYLNQVA
jgi:hypothetical protein